MEGKLYFQFTFVWSSNLAQRSGDATGCNFQIYVSYSEHRNWLKTDRYGGFCVLLRMPGHVLRIVELSCSIASQSLTPEGGYFLACGLVRAWQLVAFAKPTSWNQPQAKCQKADEVDRRIR
jgi:hypothetical protein